MGGTLPPAPVSMASLQSHPYKAGWELRVRQSTTKVTVATNNSTARTAPTMTERTGTAARPRPRSSENRRPATAGTDIPHRSAAPTTNDGRSMGSERRPVEVGSPGGRRATTVKAPESNDQDGEARYRAPSSRRRSPETGRPVGPVRSGPSGDSNHCQAVATTDPSDHASEQPRAPRPRSSRLGPAPSDRRTFDAPHRSPTAPC